MHTKQIQRLYIHVPFCFSKCDYCAFYSIPNPSIKQFECYITQILLDLQQLQIPHHSLKSLFIGGGTPTFLPLPILERLLSFLTLFISSETEFTIECNPETLSQEKGECLKKNGVNRVSLGVQSLNQNLRDQIGRKGDPKSFFSAVKILQNCGIRNLNADLIYAIPGQTESMFKQEIQQVLDLGLTHLSAYSLTQEEGTKYRIDKQLYSSLEILSESIWDHLPDWITNYNLKRYEVSNYAITAFECQHNLDIWLGDSYWAAGPSASGFDGNIRWRYPANLSTWIKKESTEKDLLSSEQRAKEIFVFGLRTVMGWDPDLYQKRTGYSLQQWDSLYLPLMTENLLQETKNKGIAPTTKGLKVWDAIAEWIL